MSAAAADDEVSDILMRVKQWPVVQQRSFALRLLAGIGDYKRPLQRPPMKIPLDQIRGMLKTDAPPPTDEECERWLEEERMGKYG